MGKAVLCVLCVIVFVVATHVDAKRNRTCFTLEERRRIWQDAGFTEEPLVRAPPIVIQRSIWATSILGTEVARILLEELMGYHVRFDLNASSEGALERVGTGDVHINLDAWASGESGDPDYQYWVIKTGKVTDAGQSGVLGQNGWFIPSYISDAHPDADMDFWRAWNRPEVYKYFRPAGQVDPSSHVAQPFVPEWCRDRQPGDECVELIAVAPQTGAGVIPQIIRNNRWNMTVAWVGFNLTSIVLQRNVQRKPVLFYYWVPSAFIDHASFTRVALKPYTTECYRNNTRDPNGYGSVDCDYPANPTHKLINNHFEQNPLYDDAVWFTLAFALDNSDYMWMLRRWNGEEDPFDTDSGGVGGNMSLPHVACALLRNMDKAAATGKGKWRWWLAHTPSRYVKDLPASERNSVLTITALLVLATIATQVALWVNRTHPVVRAATHKLCHTILLGSYAGYASVVLMAQAYSDPSICAATPGTIGVCFVLVIGSILLKNVRIHMIFNSQSLTTKPPSDTRLLLILCAMLVYELGFNTIYLVWHPQSIELTPDKLEPYADYYDCSSLWGDAFVVMYFIPKALLVLGAVYVGIRVWHVHDTFNESRKIALASYTLALETIFIFIANLFDMSMEADFLMSSAALLLGVFSANAILFGPMLYTVYISKIDVKLNLNDYLLVGGGGSGSRQSGESYDLLTQHRRLQEELERVQAERDRYRRLLAEIDGTHTTDSNSTGSSGTAAFGLHRSASGAHTPPQSIPRSNSSINSNRPNPHYTPFDET